MSILSIHPKNYEDILVGKYLWTTAGSSDPYIEDVKDGLAYVTCESECIYITCIDARMISKFCDGHDLGLVFSKRIVIDSLNLPVDFGGVFIRALKGVEILCKNQVSNVKLQTHDEVKVTYFPGGSLYNVALDTDVLRGDMPKYEKCVFLCDRVALNHDRPWVKRCDFGVCEFEIEEPHKIAREFLYDLWRWVGKKLKYF